MLLEMTCPPSSTVELALYRTTHLARTDPLLQDAQRRVQARDRDDRTGHNLREHLEV